MYLSGSELKENLSAYGFESFSEKGHYQVGPDTWVYLFESEDKNYVLISADFIDFDFDVFPHLLRFSNSEFTKMDFVLQREIPVKDNSLKEKIAGTILFEYTN